MATPLHLIDACVVGRGFNYHDQIYPIKNYMEFPEKEITHLQQHTEKIVNTFTNDVKTVRNVYHELRRLSSILSEKVSQLSKRRKQDTRLRALFEEVVFYHHRATRNVIKNVIHPADALYDLLFEIVRDTSGKTNNSFFYGDEQLVACALYHCIAQSTPTAIHTYDAGIAPLVERTLENRIFTDPRIIQRLNHAPLTVLFSNNNIQEEYIFG